MAVDINFISNVAEFDDKYRKALDAALEAVGMVAEGYAAQLSPVDTGRLRGSISHAVDSSDNSVYIGTNVEYAPYQEFGTSKMVGANGGRGYLRPAVADHIGDYQKVLQAFLGDL